MRNFDFWCILIRQLDSIISTGQQNTHDEAIAQSVTLSWLASGLWYWAWYWYSDWYSSHRGPVLSQCLAYYEKIAGWFFIFLCISSVWQHYSTLWCFISDRCFARRLYTLMVSNFTVSKHGACNVRAPFPGCVPTHCQEKSIYDWCLHSPGMLIFTGCKMLIQKHVTLSFLKK